MIKSKSITEKIFHFPKNNKVLISRSEISAKIN